MGTALTFSLVLAVSSFLGASAYAAELWSYRTEEDKLSGKQKKYASVASENKLRLDFPYSSDNNYGFITVRTGQRGGSDVMVSVGKGQILCPGYGDGCMVTVRFDKDAPMRFRAIGPSDHSSDAFFILDAQRFIARALKAKSILVGFTMHNAGEQVLEFAPSEPLQWGGSAVKKK